MIDFEFCHCSKAALLIIGFCPLSKWAKHIIRSISVPVNFMKLTYIICFWYWGNTRLTRVTNSVLLPGTFVLDSVVSDNSRNNELKVGYYILLMYMINILSLGWRGLFFVFWKKKVGIPYCHKPNWQDKRTYYPALTYTYILI